MQKGRNIFKFFDMFVWMSGYQKSLAHTDFNMFVDMFVGGGGLKVDLDGSYSQ